MRVPGSFPSPDFVGASATLEAVSVVGQGTGYSQALCPHGPCLIFLGINGQIAALCTWTQFSS